MYAVERVPLTWAKSWWDAASSSSFARNGLGRFNISRRQTSTPQDKALRFSVRYDDDDDDDDNDDDAKTLKWKFIPIMCDMLDLNILDTALNPARQSQLYCINCDDTPMLLIKYLNQITAQYAVQTCYFK